MSGKKSRKFGSYTLLLILGVMLVLVLSGCGGSDTGTSSGNGATPSGEMQVSLSTDPTPPQTGPVTFTVEVKDAAGQPVNDAQVTVSARHPSMTHGGIEGDLVPQGSGRYQASGSFSMGGNWRATVNVTKEGQPAKTSSFDLTVR